MAGKGLERKVELPRIKPRAPVMAILKSLIRPSLIGLQTKSIRVPTIGITLINYSVYLISPAPAQLVCTYIVWQNVPVSVPVDVPGGGCHGNLCILQQCAWGGGGEGGREGYRGHQITGTASTDYFKHLLVLNILVKAAITTRIQLEGVRTCHQVRGGYQLLHI